MLVSFFSIQNFEKNVKNIYFVTIESSLSFDFMPFCLKHHATTNGNFNSCLNDATEWWQGPELAAEV
jgi:hypothetical protein